MYFKEGQFVRKKPNQFQGAYIFVYLTYADIQALK